MARLIERAFAPESKVFVRRFFVAGGRHWNPGDPFDWQRLAIAQRRVKQLFDAGKLTHDPVTLTPKTPPIAAATEDADILAAAATPATEAAPEPETEAETDTVQDDLTGLDMKALREIAAAENAPSRVSRAAQRQAIRDKRKAEASE